MENKEELLTIITCPVTIEAFEKHGKNNDFVKEIIDSNYKALHLFSFKTPILKDKNKKNVKSIVGISPTMV